MEADLRTVRDLLRQGSVWLRDPKDEAAIVLSTRVRLARNISGTAFPGRLGTEARAEILENLLRTSSELAVFDEGLLLSAEKLSQEETLFLGERQLLSRDLAERPRGGGLVISPDESLVLLINEEDHIRLQSFQSGFDVDAAFEAADALESSLDAKMDFAYSDRFGFLTACPTNAGTGLRVSVLIHLAGLVLSKKIQEEIGRLQSQHWTVRGLRGEGSAAWGGFFQISNSRTLGLREGEILKNLEEAVVGLMEREREARDQLKSRARSLLEDRIWRSFGTLTHARILSAEETLHHASLLRLGHNMKILRVPVMVLSEIMALSLEMHTRFLSALKNGETDEGAWRAETIRKKLLGSQPG